MPSPLAATETGIYRGATIWKFPSPPWRGDRFKEGGPEVVYSRSVTGVAWVLQIPQTHDKLWLRTESVVVRETEDDLATLISLLQGTGALYVKPATTSTAEVLCIPAPFSMQEIDPLHGEFPDGDDGGADVPAMYRRYRVRLTFLRLE